MSRVYADRVMESTTSTGTGDITLTGALTGFQAFSDVCATDDTFDYAIFAVNGSGAPTGAWETGSGSYSAANTLTRDSVSASSNSGAPVSFAAGTKYVMLSENALSLAGGAGGGWVNVGFWDGTVDSPITELISDDLTEYTELQIIFDRVVTNAVSPRSAQFSVDGGVTYDDSGSNNYKGTLTDAGVFSFEDNSLYQAGNTSSARTMVWNVVGINLVDEPKVITGNRPYFYVGAGQITHVRFHTDDIATATGGRVIFLARK